MRWGRHGGCAYCRENLDTRQSRENLETSITVSLLVRKIGRYPHGDTCRIHDKVGRIYNNPHIPPMLYLDLGLTDYQIAWELQKRIVRSKARGLTQDFLILVEHPPTITLGLRAKKADLILPVSQIKERGIAVVEVDRGGGVTYHGPGQLVCYPIMDLRARRLSVTNYVGMLEGIIEGSLVSLGLQPMKFSGKPGIWADSERKIASIGIRIVSRITYHGFSINIDLKDTPEELIVPCGIPSTVMTDLRRLNAKEVDIDIIRSIVLEDFGRVFGVYLEPITLHQFEDLAETHG